MRRAVAVLALWAVLAGLPSAALGQIFEVADKDGNVTHYKYTDRSGSVVFTDSLASIPEAVRRKQKVVRVGPPKRPAPALPAAAPGAPEAGAPPPGAPSADTLPPSFPAPVPAGPEEAAGGFRWWMALAAGATALALAFGVRTAAARRRGPARARLHQDGGHAAARVSHHEPARPGKSLPGEECEVSRRPPPAREPVPSAEAPPRREETPQGRLERLVVAGDFAGAAQFCDAQGDVARGAEFYLKAGLYAEAAANFERLGDFRRAGESRLRGGDPEGAAACFARSGDAVRGHEAMAGYWYDRGDPRQAADWAERAGDLMRAAEYAQEAGELERAGELYLRGGFNGEAAAVFAQAGSHARAAEAFERAGAWLEAAAALERAGGDAAKAAELRDRGGEHYAAARVFVKLGALDRALVALQRIDADAPDYAAGSLLVGMIYLKRGPTAPAREKFTRLIGGRPVAKGTLEPYYFLALCLERDGDAAGAREIFVKILAEDYGFRDVRRRVEGGAAGA